MEHGVLSKKLPKEIIIVIILRSQRQNSLGRTGHTTRGLRDVWARRMHRS
jgi:hypothetical protein